jgi:surface antigen
MPSASYLGRLTIGAGALGLAFLATAGQPDPAQANTGQHRVADATPQRLTAEVSWHLTAPRVAAPAEHARPDRSRRDRRRASTRTATRTATAAAPRVSAVAPAEGAPGWTVTLRGRDFDHVTSVSFGGVGAAFTVIGRREISAVVPADAKTGQITVTGTAGRGQSQTFVVTPAQTLESGETLAAGETLSSQDGHFTLAMQTDGNLVYYVAGTEQALWDSGTAGRPGAYLTMLGNGNLALYRASGSAILWSSKTAGHGPARLVAQTDGNLDLYAGSTRTWNAGSFDNKLQPGESLRPGWSLSSGSGYRLTMRANGNLVQVGPAGSTWSSQTAGHPGTELLMRSNGNLALRDGTTLWASHTQGHPGARLIDERSGVLAVRGGGQVLWASHKAPATTLTLGRWPGRAGPAAAAKYYGYPYADPPACTHGGACHADKWAFYQGQCTSWVAYRLNQRDGIGFSNSYGGDGRWGNAVKWAAHAKALKIVVNDIPTVGSVAWYGSTKAAPDGHVAFVEKVTSTTSFVMSEMNYDADNGFWVHRINRATGDWPTAFIHFVAS